MGGRGFRCGLAAAHVGAIALAVVGLARAADLPPHPPLRILVVSDEVNPHGLSAAQLTQPGDISAALREAGSGLHLDPAPDAVVEIPTNAIEQATAALSVPLGGAAAYDVLIYFAHRIPNSGPDPQGRQDAFTAAVEAFLEAGGGMISFHHGSYSAPGKSGILDRIGATASGAVPWDTVEGQNVINTSPRHWIACQQVDYRGTRSYADAARGVAPDDYPFFNNTPDERYPFFEYNASALGAVETLFGSDYAQNGTTHLLGWVHRRAGWRGVVVGYQPGEYQPHALDDLDGSNFQILANAILFAAGIVPDDHILLRVGRGVGPDEVVLDWAGCDGSFTVYGGTDAATIPSPASELGQTGGKTWSDASAEPLVFYLVLGED